MSIYDDMKLEDKVKLSLFVSTEQKMILWTNDQLSKLNTKILQLKID